MGHTVVGGLLLGHTDGGEGLGGFDRSISGQHPGEASAGLSGQIPPRGARYCRISRCQGAAIPTTTPGVMFAYSWGSLRFDSPWPYRVGRFVRSMGRRLAQVQCRDALDVGNGTESFERGAGRLHLQPGGRVVARRMLSFGEKQP